MQDSEVPKIYACLIRKLHQPLQIFIPLLRIRFSLNHLTNLKQQDTKNYVQQHIMQIRLLKDQINILIHKTNESDEAPDLLSLLEGLSEAQIQMAHFLQPRNKRRKQLQNSKPYSIYTIAITPKIYKYQTCTITNFRLHFWTIFKNVSQAISWKKTP